MHELGTDAARIGRLEQGQQVAQLEPLRSGQRAGVEFGIEIGIGQAMEGQFQIGCGRARQQAQRRKFFLAIGIGQIEWIEVCGQMAARAIGGDQLEHAGLLLRLDIVHRRRAWRCAGNAQALRGLDARDRRGMRHIAGRRTFQRGEVRIPFAGDPGRILQPDFVEVFDEGRIASGQGGGALELLQECRRSHAGSGMAGSAELRL